MKYSLHINQYQNYEPNSLKCQCFCIYIKVQPQKIFLISLLQLRRSIKVSFIFMTAEKRRRNTLSLVFSLNRCFASIVYPSTPHPIKNEYVDYLLQVIYNIHSIVYEPFIRDFVSLKFIIWRCRTSIQLIPPFLPSKI